VLLILNFSRDRSHHAGWHWTGKRTSQHRFCLLSSKEDRVRCWRFCHDCLRRIAARMRACFRKVNAERNIPDEVASISRRYDTAQRLFNGESWWPPTCNYSKWEHCSPSQMLVQNSFADVQRQLEETVSKLKTVRDPDRRRTLLREMRRLLAEAERISSQPQNE
jgi:hypothetical protein